MTAMNEYPHDLASSHAVINQAYAIISGLQAEFEEARKQLVTTEEQLIRTERELTHTQERLKLVLSQLFGRSSERRVPEGSPNQELLFTPEEALVAREPEKEEISYTRRKRQRVEGKLPEGTRFPEHLPRKDEIINEGEGEIILTKITERLAAERSPFYVKRIIRNVRKSAEGELTTPAVPPAVIERTTVDVTFLVFMLIAKFMWHLPLYRQERMLKAQGISISRDTLIRYVISVAGLLKPIYNALGEALFEGEHLYGDETPVIVGKGEKGRKAYTESWFWTFLGKAGAVFVYSPTRGFKAIEPLIESFSGYFQSDGYTVYETMTAKYPEIVLVGCWAHARRKFIEAEKGGESELATEALRYIRALYRVERKIQERSLGPPEILRLRQRHSKRVLLLFDRWLKKKAQDPSLLPKSLFMAAVGYSLKRWQALTRYVDNPILTIDSNAVEREIRPVALGKKNWLFCASEVGAEAAAIIYSLIASCKITDVDPWDYLLDVLERISVHPASKVHELIPVNWKFLKIPDPA